MSGGEERKNSFESSAWEKDEEEGGSGGGCLSSWRFIFFHFPLILLLLWEKEVCVGVWNNGMSVG